jgi:prepilin peptidase CpaA
MDPKTIGYLIDGVLLAALLAAVYCDVRWGKIYNKITFPAMAAGLLLNTLRGGLDGTLLAFYGFGVALLMVLGLGMVAGAGLGGGDIKLLGAIGALRGPEFVLWAALFTALAGGVLALVPLIRQRILLYTLRNFYHNALARFGYGTRTEITQGSVAGKQPYGVAIFVGTLIALARFGL